MGHATALRSGCDASATTHRGEWYDPRTVNPKAPADPRWEVCIEARDHRAYAWDSLLVVVFEQPTPVEAAQAIQRFHRERIAMHSRISSITVLAGQLQLQVDPEVRRIGSEIAREAAQVGIAGAVVVPAEGWIATFYRSVITGMHIVARVKTPHRVFSRIDDAVRWICEQPGQVPAVAEHAEAIIAACKGAGLVDRDAS